MVGGGMNCCVPGCTNYYVKNNNVSYLSLPKPGVNDEWRGRLIAAISRGNKNFKTKCPQDLQCTFYELRLAFPWYVHILVQYIYIFSKWHHLYVLLSFKFCVEMQPH